MFQNKNMANKRMFSKTIVCSSRFLMMPQSSQNLYFHLGMNADDDGFCEHFVVMRMTESKPDDLKVLQAKNFVKVFDDKVLVILDWNENNTIRLDRYQPSKYLEVYKTELAEISQKNGGQPFGNQTETKGCLKLDEIRLDEIKNKEDISFPKTHKGFLNQRRIEAGKEPIPPKQLSDKQKQALKRMACLDYFHSEGVKAGFEYLLEEDKDANAKFLGLARKFEKRYRSNWKEVIDWWFEGNNAWCDFHPSNFFSINTYMKFDNRNKKGNTIDLDNL